MRPPSRFDAAIAAAAAAVLIAYGLRSGNVSSTATIVLVALALATAAPIAWRRQAPVAALAAVMAGAIAFAIVFDAGDGAVAVGLVPLYTVALYGHRRRSLVVALSTTLLLVATTAMLAESISLGAGGVRLLLLLGALVLGDTVRTRRQLRAATLERELREARDREDEHERRLAVERLRIARDVHDTLAHALVAINVRAGVAAHLGAEADSAAALTEIKMVSAQALHDLRTTLGLLREQGDAAPTTPTPDLAAVSQLVERARAAGLDAQAMVDVDVAIPSAVGQAAFRIVQESLTNVVRHAQAATATVTVSVATDQLVIDVIDDGRGADVVREGLGLRGMAERTAALGGKVASGPIPGGGWQVHAQLPLGEGRT